MHEVVEVVEAVLVDQRRKLATRRREAPRLVDDDRAVRLLDALHDGRQVERTDRAEVDDLAVDAFLRQDLRRLEAEVDGPPPRRERAVRTRAPHGRVAERDQVLALGHMALAAEHALALEEEHGVVVADRGLHQALRIGGARRDHDLDAGDIRVEAFDAPAVGRAELAAGAVVAAEHDRAAELAAGHVEHLRSVVQDRVGRDERERPRHELDDRAKPHRRGADRHAGEAGLGDRGVDDAARAELGEHALRHLVGAVVLRDFLAEQEHALVAAHLLAHRLADRVAELDLAHGSAERRRLAEDWVREHCGHTRPSFPSVERKPQTLSAPPMNSGSDEPV